MEWISFSVRIPYRMWSIEQVRRVFGQWVLHQMQAKFCPEIVVQRPYWLQCLWQKLRKMRGTEKPSSSLQVFGRWYIIKWFFNSSFVFGCLHVYSLLFVAYLQSFCWFSGVYWCNDVYKRRCIFSLNTVLIMLAFFSFLFYSALCAPPATHPPNPGMCTAHYKMQDASFFI